MKTRRDVIAIGGATASALVTGIVGVAEAAPAVDPRVAIVRRLIDEPYMSRLAVLQEADRISALMSEALMLRHPDLYNWNNAMKGPVDLINGVSVEARQRRLKTRYEPHIDATEHIETLTTETVDLIAAELRGEITATGIGVDPFCPYRPILTTGMLMSPDNFTPVMTFMTRYGIIGV